MTLSILILDASSVNRYSLNRSSIFFDFSDLPHPSGNNAKIQAGKAMARSKWNRPFNSALNPAGSCADLSYESQSEERETGISLAKKIMPGVSLKSRTQF